MENSAIVKWLIGIAASVIAGVIIWWLTTPGGSLNPATPTPQPKPILRLIDFQVDDTFSGQRAKGRFVVYNEGNVTGEDCEIWWYSGSEPGKAISSDLFGLRPDETREVEMSSLIYHKAGNFQSEADVRCRGSNVFSERFSRDVRVRSE